MDFPHNNGNLTILRQPKIIVGKNTKNELEILYYPPIMEHKNIKCDLIRAEVLNMTAVVKLAQFYKETSDIAITNNSAFPLLNIESVERIVPTQNVDEGKKKIKLHDLTFSYGANRNIVIRSTAEVNNNKLATWDKENKAVFKNLLVHSLKRTTPENDKYRTYWFLFYAKVSMKLPNKQIRTEFIFALSDPFGWSVHSSYNSKAFQAIIFFNAFGYNELFAHLLSNQPSLDAAPSQKQFGEHQKWPQKVEWSKLSQALQYYCNSRTENMCKLTNEDLLYIKNRFLPAANRVQESEFILIKWVAEDNAGTPGGDEYTFGMWFYGAMEIWKEQFCIKPKRDHLH